MVSPEHGCAKCRTLCVVSGHTMKAKRLLAQTRRTPQLGNWPLLVAWVCRTVNLFCSTTHTNRVAGGIAGLIGNPGGKYSYVMHDCKCLQVQ